jgi:hypothetical protein
MEANTFDGTVEQVTMTDILNLSTWDRPRTSDELISFISRREAALSENSDDNE